MSGDFSETATNALGLIWERRPETQIKVAEVLPQFREKTAQLHPAFEEMLGAGAFNLMVLLPLSAAEAKRAVVAALKAEDFAAAEALLAARPLSELEILKQDLRNLERPEEDDVSLAWALVAALAAAHSAGGRMDCRRRGG